MKIKMITNHKPIFRADDNLDSIVVDADIDFEIDALTMEYLRHADIGAHDKIIKTINKICDRISKCNS